jgi:hypothetical protein
MEEAIQMWRKLVGEEAGALFLDPSFEMFNLDEDVPTDDS